MALSVEDQKFFHTMFSCSLTGEQWTYLMGILNRKITVDNLPEVTITGIRFEIDAAVGFTKEFKDATK